MTTFPDRPNTALLMIDVQNGAAGRRPQRVAEWRRLCAAVATSAHVLKQHN